MKAGRVLVRGSGDVGSAVCHRLRLAGYPVILQDDPQPAHTRRGMAFVDALYEGQATLEGVLAKRARDLDDLEAMLACGRAIPATDEPFAVIVSRLRPVAIVDGVVRKHGAADPIRGAAPLTIGLGPGHEAGVTADRVIETARGEDLGRVLACGKPRAYDGKPAEIAGHGRDRFVACPEDGLFRTGGRIGLRVAAGDLLGHVGARPIVAPFAGVLRGLCHDGAWLAAGARVAEIDASGSPENAFGLGERPQRIAAGVLEALVDD